MSSNHTHLKDLLKLVQEAQNEIPLDSLISGAALIARTIKESKQLWIAGNGGSSATASHFASDLVNRCISIKGLRVRLSCLSDNVCLLTALANDHGWENVYRAQLTQCAVPGDTFIVISVLGGSRHRSDLRQSLNLVLGLQAAQEGGCQTIGIIGANGGSFARHCDILIDTKYDDACVVEPLHSLISHLLVELVIDELREPLEKRDGGPVAQPFCSPLSSP